MEQTRRKAVLGLGNLLLGDEGLGIQALPYLEAQLGRRAQVEWIDGGVLGLNLLPLIEACSHLLVVDAVDAGRPPGTVIELGPEQLRRPNELKLSEHQVTFQEVLGLAMLLDRVPAHLRLIGLQPETLEPGTTLSRPVVAALPALAERVTTVINSWGLLA